MEFLLILFFLSVQPFGGNDEAPIPPSVLEPVFGDEPFKDTIKELKATGILNDPEFLKELGEENPGLLTAGNVAMELNVPNEASPNLSQFRRSINCLPQKFSFPPPPWAFLLWIWAWA